jgi:hypothetical protein
MSAALIRTTYKVHLGKKCLVELGYTAAASASAKGFVASRPNCSSLVTFHVLRDPDRSGPTFPLPQNSPLTINLQTVTVSVH